eukprot:97815-Hanusia_phi.AAC.1
MGEGREIPDSFSTILYCNTQGQCEKVSSHESFCCCLCGVVITLKARVTVEKPRIQRTGISRCDAESRSKKASGVRAAMLSCCALLREEYGEVKTEGGR